MMFGAEVKTLSQSSCGAGCISSTLNSPASCLHENYKEVIDYLNDNVITALTRLRLIKNGIYWFRIDA